jgi:hypothetical protein
MINKLMLALAGLVAVATVLFMVWGEGGRGDVSALSKRAVPQEAAQPAAPQPAPQPARASAPKSCTADFEVEIVNIRRGGSTGALSSAISDSMVCLAATRNYCGMNSVIQRTRDELLGRNVTSDDRIRSLFSSATASWLTYESLRATGEICRHGRIVTDGLLRNNAFLLDDSWVRGMKDVQRSRAGG